MRPFCAGRHGPWPLSMAIGPRRRRAWLARRRGDSDAEVGDRDRVFRARIKHDDGGRRPAVRDAGARRCLRLARSLRRIEFGYQWGWVSHNSARPSGVAGGIQAGYNWQRGAVCVRCRSRPASIRCRRHLCGVEVFQSLVRHGAWPRRRRVRQCVALRHARPGLWNPASAKRRQRPHGIENSTSALPVAPVLEVALFQNWTARAEYLYVDFGDRSLHDYRRRSRPLIELFALWRELPILNAVVPEFLDGVPRFCPQSSAAYEFATHKHVRFFAT